MGFPNKNVRDAQRGRQIEITKLSDGTFSAKIKGQDIEAIKPTSTEAVREVQKVLQQELAKPNSKIQQKMV